MSQQQMKWLYAHGRRRIRNEGHWENAKCEQASLEEAIVRAVQADLEAS